MRNILSLAHSAPPPSTLAPAGQKKNCVFVAERSLTLLKILAAFPGSPLSPFAPSAPSSPVAPVAPVKPMGPCGPVSPCGPVLPVSPLGPVSPVSPLSPFGPCGWFAHFVLLTLPNVRIGSTAALQANTSSMTAPGGKAVPRWSAIDTEIMNVCFHRKRSFRLVEM